MLLTAQATQLHADTLQTGGPPPPPPLLPSVQNDTSDEAQLTAAGAEADVPAGNDMVGASLPVPPATAAVTDYDASDPFSQLAALPIHTQHQDTTPEPSDSSVPAANSTVISTFDTAVLTTGQVQQGTVQQEGDEGQQGLLPAAVDMSVVEGGLHELYTALQEVVGGQQADLVTMTFERGEAPCVW